jgi:hypothetical protein
MWTRLLALLFGKTVGDAPPAAEPDAEPTILPFPRRPESERPAVLPFPARDFGPDGLHAEDAPPTLFQAKWRTRDAMRRFAAAIRAREHERGERFEGGAGI